MTAIEPAPCFAVDAATSVAVVIATQRVHVTQFANGWRLDTTIARERWVTGGTCSTMTKTFL